MSARAKGYLGSGRFVAVDPDGAVFALPNQQLLARGREMQGEAEAALAARFGRPVPLKMVLDSPVAARSIDPVADPAGDDGIEIRERADLDHLQDADAAVISPEQRLLDAFPGAEEVST
jgi:hypothetical protein